MLSPDLDQLANDTQGEVQVNLAGDVLLSLPETTRRRGNTRYALLFHPVIEPSPEAFCVRTYNAIDCDFSQAPDDQKPGLHWLQTRRDGRIQQARIIYADGKAQIAYPTVAYPQRFIQAALKFPGVEHIYYTAEGYFHLRFDGQDLHLLPTLELQHEIFPSGQALTTKIDPSAQGTIEYLTPLRDIPAGLWDKNARQEEAYVRMILLITLPKSRSGG